VLAQASIPAAIQPGTGAQSPSSSADVGVGIMGTVRPSLSTEFPKRASLSDTDLLVEVSRHGPDRGRVDQDQLDGLGEDLRAQCGERVAQIVPVLVAVSAVVGDDQHAHAGPAVAHGCAS
jgi:hypothetical protein